MENGKVEPQHRATQPNSPEWVVHRRDVLKASGLVMAALSAGTCIPFAHGPGRKPIRRFGMVADAHYADTAARGTRHYRESRAKLTECVAFMNGEKVDFLIELGDLKDEGEPAAEKDTLTYLESIEAVLAEFRGPRYHVLGNHDVDSISKEQFLTRIENTGIAKASKYYSFDASGLHFVVLDADYRADGSDYDHGNFDWTDTNIPPEQLDWLKDDLESTAKPVIAFVHQQLDGSTDHCVKNAAEVRQVLQESQRVLAVFQGHNHAGHYSPIEGIHYYTLKAMVEGAGAENSSYATVEVRDDYTVVVTGYRRALGTEMKQA